VATLREQSDRLRPKGPLVAFGAIWPLLVAIGVALAIYLGVEPLVGGYWTKLLVVIGINIVLAVSLNIVNGFTGQFSIGHAGFMALGGYVAAGIVYYGSMRFFGTADFVGGKLSYSGSGDFAGGWLAKGDLLFVVSLIAGGLVAAGAGYVVGLPSLRLRGDYLAIVTLGFGEIVRVILQGTNDQIQPWKAADAENHSAFELAFMLGGPKGLNLLPSYTTLFWVYLVAVLTVLIAYRLKTSSSGRAFLSIREDEIAAQSMGVDITKYKVRAFVLSSFFAGVAGGLYALDIGAINASDLGFQKSFDIIIMVVLGGLGSISGAALAAVLLTLLPEGLRDVESYRWIVAIGLLAVVTGMVVGAIRHKVPTKKLAIRIGILVVAGVGLFLLPRFVSDLSKYRLVMYALLLIIMMIARPQGLFGVREIWEIWPFTRHGRKAGAR